MTNSFEIKDTLWKKLDGSSLKTAITGKIRRDERPVNSQTEDVVVNCLAVPNSQLQIAIANVNIFVPDSNRTDNGVTEKEANNKRLKELFLIALPIIKDVVVDTDNFYEVQQEQVIADPESASHFVNIRLNFYSANIN